MSKSQIKKAIFNLNIVYNNIPETKGCMECINKTKEEGGCGAWCCQTQSPSVLYSEFINTWQAVIKEWDVNDIILLIEKAMRNYVKDSVNKGCIFWDENSKLCKQHKTRPFACRMYGIIPKSEFNTRLAKLRLEYKDRIDANFRDQCNMVSTITGEEITQEQSDQWWDRLKVIEESMGISSKDIHDNYGGSYRTYHDHILLTLLPDNILEQLQTLRLYGSYIEKESAIRNFMSTVKINLTKLINGEK